MLTRQNLSIALVAAAGFAALALAQRVDDSFAATDPLRVVPMEAPAPTAPLGFAEVARRIENQGLQIWEMEEEDGRIEVEATDRNGRRIKLLMDAHTGAEIRRQENGR
ncbi:PepSY domain-containing protein [Sabulicella glaciei]|uniref:PepSY domain-containing protein n=1 Tax=Sabulicella glaciei TaxID=2984948 RepID=A0ABT3NYN0_9PROT|nr:PepSY domain-containing protein [Roseococcus sp. MDT2-1-1]MCW8087023.1 PepSY domain-containing protein [Roseococcus sp. MDT2-1-1]